MAIPVCLSREVCVKVKLLIYRSVYLSNLTYGLELRAMTKKIADTNDEF